MKKCNYCSQNKENIWIKKFKYWNFRVCHNQHTLGTLAVVLKTHKEFFSELDENQVKELLKIIKIGQKILTRQFKPDWFNVQQNGNWERHLHVLLIPRYKKSRLFSGKIFIDKTFGNPVLYKNKGESSTLKQKLAKVLKNHN